MADLRDVVASGDRVKSLEAMRDLLASRLSAAQYDKDVAPLSKRLDEVMAELAALSPPKRESRVDELAAERAKRRAKVPDGSGGGKQRRRGGGAAAGVGEPSS